MSNYCHYQTEPEDRGWNHTNRYSGGDLEAGGVLEGPQGVVCGARGGRECAADEQQAEGFGPGYWLQQEFRQLMLDFSNCVCSECRTYSRIILIIEYIGVEAVHTQSACGVPKG